MASAPWPSFVAAVPVMAGRGVPDVPARAGDGRRRRGQVDLEVAVHDRLAVARRVGLGRLECVETLVERAPSTAELQVARRGPRAPAAGEATRARDPQLDGVGVLGLRVGAAVALPFSPEKAGLRLLKPCFAAGTVTVRAGSVLST